MVDRDRGGERHGLSPLEHHVGLDKGLVRAAGTPAVLAIEVATHHQGGVKTIRERYAAERIGIGRRIAKAGLDAIAHAIVVGIPYSGICPQAVFIGIGKAVMVGVVRRIGRIGRVEAMGALPIIGHPITVAVYVAGRTGRDSDGIHKGGGGGGAMDEKP